MEKGVFERYLEVSGMNRDKLAKAISEFRGLCGRIDTAGMDIRKAGIQIDKTLKNDLGYNGYIQDRFRAQDILKDKGGNCLGLPLFVASVLAEKGYNPKFGHMVNPTDVTTNLEESHVKSLWDSVPYNASSEFIVSQKTDSPIFRGRSLEHLVVDLEGFLLETTDKRGGKEFKGSYESINSIGIDEALSLLYGEAYTEGTRRGEFNEDSINEGLELWPGNRLLLYCDALSKKFAFDDEGYENAKRKFIEMDSDDSLWCTKAYLLTGERKFLDRSLELYSGNAEALALRASSFIGEDNGEAKTQFAIASDLCANSQFADLDDFYIDHAKNLGDLFGNGKILDYLLRKGVKERNTSDFSYRLALYHLSGNVEHLANSEDLAITPFQKIQFHTLAQREKIGKRVNSEQFLKNVNKMYGKSEIYGSLREHLNNGRKHN